LDLGARDVDFFVKGVNGGSDLLLLMLDIDFYILISSTY